jgi:hypothetical protein
VEGDYIENEWGPVGPKLVFHQMAAPVPEIRDTSNIHIHIHSLVHVFITLNVSLMLLKFREN